VGTNLHHGLKLKGVRTELVHARPLTAEHPNQEENPQAEPLLPQADVYIYAVADHALKAVVEKVYAPKSIHLLTSGTMPMEVFGPDKPHAGVLYFFQSFSREVLIDDWSGIPCFISGRNIDDVAAIYSLAQMLTSRIYEADQHDRERLHVAGVFANNFSNLMYRMAADILADTQIPFQALLPLIDQTAQKVHMLAPRNAQTGPAQRGDEAVMAHPLDVLAMPTPGSTYAPDEKAEVYRLLSKLIQKNGTRC